MSATMSALAAYPVAVGLPKGFWFTDAASAECLPEPSASSGPSALLPTEARKKDVSSSTDWRSSLLSSWFWPSADALPSLPVAPYTALPNVCSGIAGATTGPSTFCTLLPVTNEPSANDESQENASKPADHVRARVETPFLVLGQVQSAITEAFVVVLVRRVDAIEEQGGWDVGRLGLTHGPC